MASNWSTLNFDLNLEVEDNPPHQLDLNLEVEDDPSHQEHHQLDLNLEPEDSGDGVLHHEGNDNIPQEERRHRNFPSNEQRLAIRNALLERSINGKLGRNITQEVASIFSVSLRTIQRIWKKVKDAPSSIGTVVDVSHKKTKNCGRKRIEIDLNAFVDIPLRKRSTLRSTAAAMNINHVLLYNRIKEGIIRRHSNAIKPHLKEENKKARLQFCLSMLDQNSLSHEPKFVGMYNVVHIDEKWFYMTKKSERYYLLPTEEEPLRSCKSKNYIGKVMFLVAMARPRFDNAGNEVFSGKIGVFPFVTKQPAQRRSRNRDAGTLETKPITSIKRETIRACLLEKVIPKIKEMWPSESSNSTTFIQQDNARTHVHPNDEEFRIAASENGFDIRLMCQPPNSPDLNILDLGFFSAIQALQQKVNATTVDELVQAVEKSFDEYPTRKVNYIFLTLQLCMREIMKIGGSNRYKIPHMNKNRLDRDGCLPTHITCDSMIVQSVMNQLQ